MSEGSLSIYMYFLHEAYHSLFFCSENSVSSFAQKIRQHFSTKLEDLLNNEITNQKKSTKMQKTQH